MFSSPHQNRASGDGQTTEGAVARSSSGDLSFRADYYGGDFVEDGSFLVLSTDALSLSPTTPPGTSDGEDRDMEVVDEVDEGEEEDEPKASGTPKSSSLAKSQVLGEDLESSVESSLSVNKQGEVVEDNGSLRSQLQTLTSIMTNGTTTSSSSVSTDTHLLETGEEVSLLVAENKKLTGLLGDSNEKMKQCITTTEKLKADHEEYKKKHEVSRDIISQLRQDNDMLRSQVSMIQSRVEESTATASQSLDMDKELRATQDSLERQSHTISELNDRLKTVLTVNGQLNDQLLGSQKANDELREEVAALLTEKREISRKLEVMIAEIESGRQAIAKFKEHQGKAQNELESSRSIVHNLEGVIEEKTKLTESLRRNMEDTVTSLERCNYKLNQKEQEISLLTTKLAAINAETEVLERLQVLEMQCQSYRSDYEKVREEKAKLAAEKDALLIELNAANQQLRATSDTLENFQRQSVGDRENYPVFEREPSFQNRNDNSAAANANESLPSPLTSLPTVAGQFVGFVRRELLGWEDQAAASGEANPTTADVASGGSSETVVQQPKQEAIPPCPICRRTFSSLERLQTHASNCGIETDENPQDPFVFP